MRARLPFDASWIEVEAGIWMLAVFLSVYAVVFGGGEGALIYLAGSSWLLWDTLSEVRGDKENI